MCDSSSIKAIVFFARLSQITKVVSPVSYTHLIVLYSLGPNLFPEGDTSTNRRIRPDFASVIFTGLFVPMNTKHLQRFEYVALNFSFTVISSCDTRLFNLVLSLSLIHI